MSVALIAVFVLVALALVAGGLYLFSSGLTARAGACRPPLGLRLPGVEIAPDSGPEHKLRCLRALALF